MTLSILVDKLFKRISSYLKSFGKRLSNDDKCAKIMVNMATKRSKALRVADYFILKSRECDRPISNKKVNKLVYYAQAWSLVLLNKKLYNNKISAWMHGPVITDVYHEFKEFGFKDIGAKIDKPTNLNQEELELLDDVWERYGVFNADYLETLTHYEEPWIEAFNRIEGGDTNDAIDTNTMKRYYEQKNKEARESRSKKAQGSAI